MEEISLRNLESSFQFGIQCKKSTENLVKKKTIIKMMTKKICLFDF